MQIKGTAVKSIDSFVRVNYSEQYEQWIENMPPETRVIYSDAILATHWYPLKEAGVAPTKLIGTMFFNSISKGAWESGRFSAESALKGVYKVFVKLASPSYIINRASKIFSTYYTPSKLIIPSSNSKGVVVEIVEFETPESVIEERIGGWMEKALELSGCNEIKINIKQSLTKGAPSTIFDITWK